MSEESKNVKFDRSELGMRELDMVTGGATDHYVDRGSYIRLAKSSTSEYNHGYSFVGGMPLAIETYLEA